MEFFILNVFSDQGVTGGNQLAVVPDAAELTDAQMQAIAREFNYSESTFVTRQKGNEADVRIFTPGREIEYAGHPTIGTLHVLETLHRQANEGRSTFDLNLKAGRVQGKFGNPDGDLEIVSFEQMPARLMGEFEQRSDVSDLLGTSAEMMGPALIMGVTTMKFLFVRLPTAKDVDAVSPDLVGLGSGRFEADDISVYVFAGERGGPFRARMFVPLYGIPEDPATGGIQSSFGLCLLQHQLLDEGKNEVVVEQGDQMGRPSRIYNTFEVRDGKLVFTVTGGRCFVFASGRLRLSDTTTPGARS